MEKSIYFGNYTFIKYLLYTRNCAMDSDTKMNNTGPYLALTLEELIVQ